MPLAAVLALLSWLAAPAPGPDAAAALESLSAPAASPGPAAPRSQLVQQASAAVYACDTGSGVLPPAAQPCQSVSAPRGDGDGQALAGR